MAINAYTGLMGSGKSYEVTNSVIVPAILAGRRVVTNIDGVNEKKIHDYLIEQRHAQPDKLGRVVHITNERITEPQFFPDETKPELESVVQAGDLVAIDEAWRFWPADGGKLSAEHMQFFRMHRHYTHLQTGVSCDVALMIQDITGLHRSLKNVVEFNFRTTKHKSLGIHKHYRVDVYEGYKQTAKNLVNRQQKRYDPIYFPMYKSYAGSNGTETKIDDRTNIFKKGWLLPVTVVTCIGFAWGLYTLYKFFTPAKSQNASLTKTGNNASATNLALPSGATPNTNAPTFSTLWRIAGTAQFSGQHYVILAGPTGRLRYEHPSNFLYTGTAMIGKVDGETITTYSGNTAPPALLPTVPSK